MANDPEPPRTARPARRKRPTATLAPCRMCQRIRLFVAVAAMLIVGLPLAGGNLAIVAVLTPWHFAAAVMVLGLLVTFLKVLEARSQRPRSAGPSAGATDHTPPDGRA